MTRALAGLLVGRTLADRYEIEEMIGRGGMSLVYRARDRRLHRPVAVKVISLPSDSEHQHLMLRERLRREAAAAARVPPHPNVVQVYDYGTDEELDLDFIAMELLEGQDLKALLREGPLPYSEGIRILREAARGLAAGHRAGIVHRDVKPANIVVTTERPAGTVKLLDFGIAKALEAAIDDDLTRPGQLPHSPTYASPEQLRPGEPVTPASDVYQLGLVAHEILAGEKPVEGRPSYGGRWATLPEPVRIVVETALETAPERRYRDAASFAEALSRAAYPDEGTRLMPAASPARGEEEDAFAAAAPPPGTATGMGGMADGAAHELDDETRAYDAEHEPGAPAAVASSSASRVGTPADAAWHPPAREQHPGRGVWKLLLWGSLAVVVLLVLRGMLMKEDESPRPEALLPPEVEELDEQFRVLLQEAHENLQQLEAPEPEP